MIYLLLFWEFFKIGLFAIGGGLASLPFLFDLAGRYDWFTTSELANMVAVGESTPGPIAINMATYVGYHTAGVGGSLIATTAIILPPLLISLLVCRVLCRCQNMPWLERAFWGLRPAVAGLISVICYNLMELALAADLDLGFQSGVSWKALILFVLLLPAIFYFKKHPLIYIGIGAVVGIVFQL